MERRLPLESHDHFDPVGDFPDQLDLLAESRDVGSDLVGLEADRLHASRQALHQVVHFRHQFLHVFNWKVGFELSIDLSINQ